jgi:uncharacterized membrane protein YgcG
MEKPQEKPEHSLGLRITTAVITVLCLMAAAFESQTTTSLVSLLWSIVCIWLAITGSYLSWYLREKRVAWMPWVVSAGLLLIMLRFMLEIVSEWKVGRLEGLIPFIHVLMGLSTLQTFDLKTRADINISILIAIGLFCCAAVRGTDLLFGVFVFLLVGVGAAMLFFEAKARTNANRGTADVEVSQLLNTQTRPMRGSALLPILALPVLSMIFFCTLPRTNSIFDALISYFRIQMPTKSIHLSHLPAKNDNPDADAQAKTKKKDAASKPPPGSNESLEAGDGYDPNRPAATAPGKAKKNSSEKTVGTIAGAKKGANGNGGEGGTGGINGKGGSSANGGAKGKSGPGGKSIVASDAKSTNAKNGGKQQGSPNNNGGPGGGKIPPPQMQALETDDLVFRNSDSATRDDEVFLFVNSPEPVYLRRMFFDQYDGHHWTVSRKTEVADCEKMVGPNIELGGVPSLHVPAHFKCREVTQNIWVMAPIGHILPATDIPQTLAIGEEKVTVDDFGVLRCKNELKPILRYELVSKIPSLDLGHLRNISTDSPQARDFKEHNPNYLQLPSTVPEEVKEVAFRIGGNEGNWFVKAERMCNYLRAKKKYSTAPFKDQEAHDLVDEFLFRKQDGACGEFSSSMVVMCRTLGIPARMVGGFLPGEFNTQRERYEIKGKDGHAWAEIYMPEAGWIPFDATPTGTLPAPPPSLNPWLASIDKSLKDLAAGFNLQQMDKQLAEGKDENYPIKVENLETRGLMRNDEKKDIDVDLADGSSAGKHSRSESPKALAKAATKYANNKLPENQLNLNKIPPLWLGIFIFGLVVIIAAAGAIIYFRAHLRKLFMGEQYPRISKGVKPSTLVFLKLSDDLRRLKILRRPSDTAEELRRRFLDHFSEDEPCHPELPILFDQFITLYSEDRFGAEEDSLQRYRELRDLGTKISILARSKYVEPVAS